MNKRRADYTRVIAEFCDFDMLFGVKTSAVCVLIYKVLDGNKQRVALFADSAADDKRFGAENIDDIDKSLRNLFYVSVANIFCSSIARAHCIKRGSAVYFIHRRFIHF